MEVEVSRDTSLPASSASSAQRTKTVVRLPDEGAIKIRVAASKVFLLLLAAFFACILISASTGAVSIPLRSLVGALLQTHSLTPAQETILFSIRLPRVLAAALVGGALSLSGLMFQGLFRNPLADPYIIGASGGAAVGACIGTLFLTQYALFGFSATALLAFAGAFATMLLVYSLARSNGRTLSVTLLLAGFAVGTMLSNSTYLFEVFDPNPTFGNRVVTAWLHGSIGVPEWRQLAIISVALAAAVLSAYPLMHRLNTLTLGDEYAHQLGLRVEATRMSILVVGSLLTAIAVSLGGLISFVGLIVPHVVRMLIGPDHVRLLPVTILAGAIFLVLSDTLARTLFAPSEIPVGILMVFFGGPFFLYLLRKGKREFSQ